MEPPKPPVSQDTPDNTIRSVWALLDWQETQNLSETARGVDDLWAFSSRVKTHMQESARSKLTVPRSSSRNTIDRVEVESDTRAVIWAHVYPEGRETNPVVTKYLLTKEATRWMVEDVLSPCIICKGSGETEDYEKKTRDLQRRIYDSDPRKKCEYCKGLGWKSTIY
jgi:hypothetical protein